MRARKTCRCGVTFVGVRSIQAYADHTWVCYAYAEIRKTLGWHDSDA